MRMATPARRRSSSPSTATPTACRASFRLTATAAQRARPRSTNRASPAAATPAKRPPARSPSAHRTGLPASSSAAPLFHCGAAREPCLPRGKPRQHRHRHLTLTGFDPATGALSHTPTRLTGGEPARRQWQPPIPSAHGQRPGGDSASGTLTINILDTARVANADTNSIGEDAAPNSVGGNVITTGAGADTSAPTPPPSPASW